MLSKDRLEIRKIEVWLFRDMPLHVCLLTLIESQSVKRNAGSDNDSYFDAFELYIGERITCLPINPKR